MFQMSNLCVHCHIQNSGLDFWFSHKYRVAKIQLPAPTTCKGNQYFYSVVASVIHVSRYPSQVKCYFMSHAENHANISPNQTEQQQQQQSNSNKHQTLLNLIWSAWKKEKQNIELSLEIFANCDHWPGWNTEKFHKELHCYSCYSSCRIIYETSEITKWYRISHKPKYFLKERRVRYFSLKSKNNLFCKIAINDIYFL